MPKEYKEEDYVLDSDDEKISEEITEEQNKKLEEYNRPYKNILWIDDRADGGADAGSHKWMQRWVKDKKNCTQIEQVKYFRDAMDKIIENASQYDLVIFDINLQKGFVPESDEKPYIEEKFGKYHIKFTYPLTEDEHMSDGYYLFRLLLAVGYPLERMRILSCHTTIKKAQTVLNDIIIDDHIYLEKKEGKLDIENSFFARGTHDYYRVRRLVYQACAYWIEKLKGKKTDDIPFNKLYKLKTDSRSFSSILEHIKMLFPVKPPSDLKSVYFRALQIAAAFHEESADIIQIDKQPKLRKYHICIRNFRNWSAHNKMISELNGDMFAVLFCIALRTYFEWMSDDDLKSPLLPYEDKFGFNRGVSIDQNSLKKNLYKFWKEIHEKINNDGVKEKYKGFYRDLSKAIHNLGYVKGINDMENYLFFPIWSVDSFDVKPDISDNETYVSFTLKNNEIKYLIDAANSKGAAGCFMRFCYQWLNFD